MQLKVNNAYFEALFVVLDWKIVLTIRKPSLASPLGGFYEFLFTTE